MTHNLKNIFMLLIVVLATYAAHYLILSGMDVSDYWSQTDYSLTGLYVFGAISSLIVIFAVAAIQYALPKFLGLVFLALMFLKGVASYIYIKDGLNKFENDFIEYNFLTMFFIFLFFDVFIAFRALNQEDKTVKNY